MKNKEILLDVIGDVDEMYVPELIAAKKKNHSLMYFAIGGVSVATIAAGIMLLTGLNSKDRINSPYERVLSFFQDFGENNDNPMTEPEQLAVVRLDSDRAVPASAEQLEEYSTAIIEGTISEQLNTVREPSGLGMTYYQVEVESVLYGTLAENETAIRIWQPWWISMDGSQIETFSDLKPLQVGNRRIFALSYSETNGTYAISCDSDGCMPIPTADLLNGSLSDPEVLKVMEEEYNLYDGEDIRYGYYRDVLLRYRDQIRIPSSTLKTNSRDHRTHMVSYKDVVFYISKDGKIDVVDSNERKWLPNIDFTAIDLEIFLETLFITDSKGDVHLYQLSEGTIGSEITLEDLKSEESPDLSLGVTDMLHARKNLLNLTNVQDVSVLRTDASTYFVITESENGTQAICIIGDDVYTANPEPSHGKPVAISGGAVLYEDGSVHSPWKGLLPTGTIEDYDYSSWDNVIDICFDGVFGIREDGTVLVRDNKYATVRKWNNISSVTVRPNPDSINDVYALTNDGYLMNNHLYRNNLDFLVDNKINVSDLIVIDHRLIGLNENSEPVIIELPEQ